jgi:hypothetical protein
MIFMQKSAQTAMDKIQAEERLTNFALIWSTRSDTTVSVISSQTWRTRRWSHFQACSHSRGLFQRL